MSKCKVPADLVTAAWLILSLCGIAALMLMRGVPPAESAAAPPLECPPPVVLKKSLGVHCKSTPQNPCWNF